MSDDLKLFSISALVRLGDPHAAFELSAIENYIDSQAFFRFIASEIPLILFLIAIFRWRIAPLASLTGLQVQALSTADFLVLVSNSLFLL